MNERAKRPAYQWYPGDFRRDTALQACSFEARALWREMLDLMHDGEPYGHLTAGGVPIAAADLARMVGKPLAAVSRWMAEMEARRVFSRTEDGIIYSRRMVRDERNRMVRAAGGPKSLDNPNVPRPKEERMGGKDTFPPSIEGSPATATASAIAEQPSGSRAALALAVQANKGLAEHSTRPQRIPRIMGNGARTLAAAEAIIAAGVPLDFAEGQVYMLAKNHNADGEIKSLKYFEQAVIRAWEEFTAEAAAGSAPRPSTNGKHAPRPGIGGRAYLTTLDAIKDL